MPAKASFVVSFFIGILATIAAEGEYLLDRGQGRQTKRNSVAIDHTGHCMIHVEFSDQRSTLHLAADRVTVPCFFPEKEALLDFAVRRTTGIRTGVCEDDISSVDGVTWPGGQLWTEGGIGIDSWRRDIPTCTFQGIECYPDGHVRRMCEPPISSENCFVVCCAPITELGGRLFEWLADSDVG